MLRRARVGRTVGAAIRSGGGRRRRRERRRTCVRRHRSPACSLSHPAAYRSSENEGVHFAVARIEVVAHAREAGLLERTDRRAVPDVGVGDTRASLERGRRQPRPRRSGSPRSRDPRPIRLGSAMKRSRPAASVSGVDEHRVLRVIRQEIRLDEADRRDRRPRWRTDRSDRCPRSTGGSARPTSWYVPRSPHQRSTCSRPSHSCSSGRSSAVSGLNAISIACRCDTRTAVATAGSWAARSRRCCPLRGDADAARTTA